MKYKLVLTPPYKGPPIMNDSCRLCCCANHENNNNENDNSCDSEKRHKINMLLLEDCTERKGPVCHYELIDIKLPININIL